MIIMSSSRSRGKTTGCGSNVSAGISVFFIDCVVVVVFVFVVVDDGDVIIVIDMVIFVFFRVDSPGLNRKNFFVKLVFVFCF